MILEALIPVAALAAQYLWQRHAGTRRIVEQAARASFGKAVATLGITDKVQAHSLFRATFDAIAQAAGWRPSSSRTALADKLFQGAWELHQRQAWDATIEMLRAAGKRGERLGAALERLQPPVPVRRAARGTP